MGSVQPVVGEAAASIETFLVLNTLFFWLREASNAAAAAFIARDSPFALLAPLPLRRRRRGRAPYPQARPRAAPRRPTACTTSAPPAPHRERLCAPRGASPAGRDADLADLPAVEAVRDASRTAAEAEAAAREAA